MVCSGDMKYWETEHHIPLPWPEVVSGYWWRYPNPSSSHVFSVDTLDTRLEGDTLYARRLIMKTNSLPSWGKHFFPDARVAVIEEVVVDRYVQYLTLTAILRRFLQLDFNIMTK